MRHSHKKEFRGIGGLGAGIETRNPMDGGAKRRMKKKRKKDVKQGWLMQSQLNRKQARDPRYRIYARGCDLHSPIGKPHPAW